MPALTDLRILVVDDVNTMRTQLKDILRAVGIEQVMMASNGEEAKLILETEFVHIIVADWHMSPTDGMELLKFVRTNPKLAKAVGFLMLTAESTKERVLQAIQSGVDDYVVKPVSPPLVQNKILNVMKKRGF